MSPDLNALQLVEENIQVADDATYVDASEFPAPHPAGTYNLTQGKPEFSATKKGALQALMNHKINGGEYDGQEVRFDRINDQPFERGGVMVNGINDHLRAVYGPNERPSMRSHTERAQALEAAEGRPFKAVIDWEAGCNHKDTQHEVDWNDKEKVFRLKRMTEFPQNGNGTYKHEVPCPTCGETVYARERIVRRIASN